ncbi:DUF1634 domain-containing protein [Aciditerrimonas ferrireducens]|uniref:DUF1634 domain-containing protein n=1 Tax=Aciditerrimonas ferrireducens TaxID=667306 RepID=UPI00200694D8|nr:DUF1634 domain-containing protein [Aciditerrimonas ferrireducens]MCK4176092.1 DUF1634 domain-containing protein [Aciditerrimonas ferrireducens]
MTESSEPTQPASPGTGSGAAAPGPGALTATPDVVAAAEGGVAGGSPSDIPDDPVLHKLETVVSWVLRIGVVLAVAIVLAGLIMTFLNHPDYSRLTHGVRYQALTSPHSPFPHTVGQLGRALAAGEGRGVIVLGLVVLLATPVLRVGTGR